jgi:hypothetical protein
MMIRTGQIHRQSKWYVFINEHCTKVPPQNNEFLAEEEAKLMFPNAVITTTEDKDHPIHKNPWPMNPQQVAKWGSKAKLIEALKVKVQELEEEE